MKERFKKFVNKNKWLIITFLLSTIVISIIYAINKIAPFGSNSMLDVDFYHQYGPLLNELYDRIKSGESLLFSFNTGGGIPFYRNYLNYLSSPFNIILLLFSKKNLVMGFSIIIALKAILASCTMAFYLKHMFKKDNYLIAIFGMLYAFSGYFCAYYWNIMWLDGMVFLPLVVWGITLIVDKDKPLFYIISLAVMLLSNYFIGYMVCIFSVIYFIGYFLYRKNYKLKKVLIFFVSSLLAGGLVAVAIVPLYYALSSISATNGGLPGTDAPFKIYEFIFNHLTGVSRTVFASDPLPLPNVYPGIITLVCTIAMFTNKKINWRAKIFSLITILFFLLCFDTPLLDYFWHAFHVPNDLPWRYSFIYVFVLITIGYYGMIRIKETSLLRVSISFAIILLTILVANKTGFVNIDDMKSLCCIIFVTAYYIFYLILRNPTKKDNIFKALFVVMIMAECVYGITANWNINHNITEFMSTLNPVKELISCATDNDNDLYRIEKTNYLTLNDGAWYDYSGISTFTSMAYENTAKFQRMIGLAGNDINSYYYQGYQTPVYNTMFNVKYLIGDLIDNDYYVPIKLVGSTTLVGYNYSSSLVYMLNEDINNWNLISYLPFYNQKQFIELGTGVTGVYEPIMVSKVDGGFITTTDFEYDSNGEFVYELNDESNTINLYIENEKEQNIYLYVGGPNVSSYSVNGNYYSLTSDEYYTVDTGKFDKGTITISIKLKSNESSVLKFYAYTINDDKFKKFYSKINSGILDVTKYNDTMIEGTITAEDNQTAFTTISYDKGWMVYVDGKEVKTKKVANVFLSFNVPKGTHKIKIIYYPYKMKLGLIISMVSIIILIAYIIINKKISKKDEIIV